MGVLEEGAKAAGGVIDALRGSPVALAMGIMNIALLLFLFYYLSRITQRTETTVQALFTANDKLYTQWGVIVKDTNDLTEKAMHCILPDDAIKLLQTRPAAPAPPAAPQRPMSDEPPLPPLRPSGASLWEELNKPAPVPDPPKPAGVPEGPKPQE